MSKILSLLFAFMLLSYGNPALAEIVNITLLQLNDVYEIEPISGGKVGGLARVATIRKELIQANPNTYTILAGDFVSPSALGTARINNQPLAGQQMIAVLNAMGLDFATFGNHEFDIKLEQLLERIKESKFTWISGNVLTAEKKPFPDVLPYKIITVTRKEGNPVKIGLIGVTLDSNPVNYVTYNDPIETAKQQVSQLKDKVDIIVAITHLSLAQDQKLAETIPEIDIILGGHEHENIQQWRGSDFTPVFKADANAKTVYIHQLNYDTDNDKLSINSQIKPVTDSIIEEEKTAKVAQEWREKGFKAFRDNGFEPEEVIAKTTVELDGLESSVRNHSTDLTDLISQAMLTTVETADLSIFNGGSIRIDDVLPPGNISQYDIIRILPFGGQIVSVDMKGSLIKQVLEQGIMNKGSGGFLQHGNVTLNQNTWYIKGEPINLEKIYRVAITDFLMTGKEIGLDYLTYDNPDVKLIEEKGDIRFTLINQLKNHNAQ
ncbi:bifunctional metallophosphatase/5'-nucleotidase [Crocosphaera sp. UHCC 0190]|uniref:bifunctional metallophosphatase/5'-nucleotidase n=1 Tax=Crocosphaera sp. UHCC 0190 TaxID=3110246 RepID=UPI002B2040A7|nr:bifunctional metallophosphatase/5'-nucleotidase [Crocosphaera sp. UHCC 0190]MEA5509564.1 bifunctional metallophosphatase/5'-nucleotidase [Crocosphaera sp. UHCC 0190]